VYSKVEYTLLAFILNIPVICMFLNRESPEWTLQPGGVQLRGFIQKFLNWVDNEMNNNNKHSLRSNTKGYGGKTH
jgi:hypothetical protein